MQVKGKEEKHYLARESANLLIFQISGKVVLKHKALKP